MTYSIEQIEGWAKAGEVIGSTVACEMIQEIKRLRRALDKIADPRKRDHVEVGTYTQLACVMNIAQEALDHV